MDNYDLKIPYKYQIRDASDNVISENSPILYKGICRLVKIGTYLSITQTVLAAEFSAEEMNAIRSLRRPEPVAYIQPYRLMKYD